MCYSAKIKQDLKSLSRRFGAYIDEAAFEDLFLQRLADNTIKIPKGMETNFDNPTSPAAKRIKELISQFREQAGRELEQNLFKERARLAVAVRQLKTKPTKKAASEERIATNKIENYQLRLANLHRIEPRSSDDRIYPFYYAPVLIQENGEYVIKPMRYHCRPHGKPDSYDKRYDGLYNARRDNLEGFWRNLFGQLHGIVVMTEFYENVALHDFERRALRPDEKEQNIVLHFSPQPEVEMLVASMWSHWTAPGKRDLYSFAAITDDPPAEIAATGHDRCVVPLQEQYVTTWLCPGDIEKEKLYQMLDDRERPFYEHKIAA